MNRKPLFRAFVLVLFMTIAVLGTAAGLSALAFADHPASPVPATMACVPAHNSLRAGIARLDPVGLTTQSPEANLSLHQRSVLAAVIRADNTYTVTVRLPANTEPFPAGYSRQRLSPILRDSDAPDANTTDRHGTNTHNAGG